MKSWLHYFSFWTCCLTNKVIMIFFCVLWNYFPLYYHCLPVVSYSSLAQWWYKTIFRKRLKNKVSTWFNNHISMIYFSILSIVGVFAVESIYDLECTYIFNLTPLRLTLYHHILYIVICIYWGIRRCLHAYSFGIDENIQT